MTTPDTAQHPLLGKVVRDTTVTDRPARYAIGKTGFLDLHTGDWLPYDSAFPGPQYFTGPAFTILGHTEAIQPDPTKCSACGVDLNAKGECWWCDTPSKDTPAEDTLPEHLANRTGPCRAFLVHDRDDYITKTFDTVTAAVMWIRTEDNKRLFRGEPSVFDDTFTAVRDDYIQFGTGYHYAGFDFENLNVPEETTT